jgi:hypothetical protein
MIWPLALNTVAKGRVAGLDTSNWPGCENSVDWLRPVNVSLWGIVAMYGDNDISHACQFQKVFHFSRSNVFVSIHHEYNMFASVLPFVDQPSKIVEQRLSGFAL